MPVFLASGPTATEALVTVIGIVVGVIAVFWILFKKNGPKK